MKPIHYGKHNISEADIKAVAETLRSDFLTQGPKAKEFEIAFARYIGANYGVAVNNGTSALHLCMLALGVNEHSRVITTPITFAASANCVRFCGGQVDFVDIDPDTALIDLREVEKKLSAAPKGTYSGIIPVDFAGYPVDMEQLHDLAEQYDLWVVEDACHAPGGYFTDSKGEKQFCGNGVYAEGAIFSFHPVKHIACGEGGMVVTNQKDFHDRVLRLRSHGITKDPELLHENHGGWYYEMQELSENCRITDFQAALGISQLSRADQGLARRREIAHIYDQAFQDLQGMRPLTQESDVPGHAYHLYVILAERRLELYNYLQEKNIFSQVHYIPVHLMPYYRQFGWKKGDFPVAEAYYEQCLSLPLYPSLTDEEQNFVIEQIYSFYGS